MKQPSVQGMGLLVLAACLTQPAWAAEEQRLKAITVTATGLPTEVFDNPASITVVGADALQQSAPVSVAKLLRDVPGVQISEEGIERISIRGESSRRVAVLIDGQKLTDHTNYGQPLLIDPASIERIEIVRGSSSVTSGSQAIGGVINIITKKGAAQPVQLTVSTGWISATSGWRSSVSVAGTVEAGAGAFDYRLHAGRMKQKDRKTPQGAIERSDTEDRTLLAHAGYRVGAHYLGLKLQQYDLGANVPTGNPEFTISLPQRDLKKVGLFYEAKQLTPWLESLSFDLHRQTVDRVFSNNVTQRVPGVMSVNVLSDSEDAQSTFGASLRAGLRLSPQSRTVLGLEWEDDRLQADKSTQTTTARASMPRPVVTQRLRYDDATILTSSLFGQHETELAQELMLTLGARWYDVRATHDVSRQNGADLERSSNSDRRGLFSGGLVWTGLPHWALRANVSQGYIHPSLAQMFLSTTAGGAGTLLGNAQLKPERATTYEVGARYAAGPTELDATLFLSDAKDYIASVVVDGSNPMSTISQYQNVDRARTWGLEVQAAHRSDVWGLQPYLTATLLRRQFHFANGYRTHDSGTPSVSSRLGVRKPWTLGTARGEVDLFLRGESSVKVRGDDGQIQAQTAGYATLNLHASAQLTPSWSVALELNNLSNRTYQPYGQMLGAKRSVNLFANYQF